MWRECFQSGSISLNRGAQCVAVNQYGANYECYIKGPGGIGCRAFRRIISTIICSGRPPVRSHTHGRCWGAVACVFAHLCCALCDRRQYLESRSLNQRLEHREQRSPDMACDQDAPKDRDLDWHHYSKSSGRSRRSSRRHRDRRRRRSHSRHRSPSVRSTNPSPPPSLSPVSTIRWNGSLSAVFGQCSTPIAHFCCITLYSSLMSGRSVVGWGGGWWEGGGLHRGK